jgi:hypothetical protein
MITEQRIRNVLESLTYKAAAGSTIAVEAIAVITELAKLRAEPPRPAAIEWTREKPTEPGWYWGVGAWPVEAPRIVAIRRNPDGELRADGYDVPDGALWCGPLKPPARAAEGEAK